MSIQDNDPLTPEEEFSNAAMRRALQHAPDHAAAPDWRIRRAIQQRAREALAPPTVEEELGVPWWKRLWAATGSRGSGNRMPWNAAFATVALAVLVTLLWQREPVPGAKLDGEAQVTVPAAPPPAVPEPPPVQAPAPAPAPAPAKAPEAAAESRPQGKAMAPAPPVAERAPEPSSVPAPTPPAPPAPDRAARDSARAEAPAAGARSAIAERESKKLEADDEVPPPASAPKAAREAPPVAPAAAPSTAPTAPTVPAPVSPPAADRRSRANAAPAEALSAAPPPAAQGSVGASAAPAAPATAARAPAASAERTDATEPPTFAALSQWNRLVITQSSGAARSVTRAEAGELAPLMGSAAISAVEPRRLAGRVDWRISLERDGKVLAVLELAQGQVRWREGSTPSATGVPSAGALDALRRALAELMAPPKPTSSEPVAEPSR